ncbi:aldo/keto reductase [Suhomyces tanzawaensis NRRL Y-17324]|uniref:2-dehydropantolactone reductase n=1 Tax=Suhomyces tanzawaensis NRRL Y-17324 TaxID=984487 RepID=A0A1E4SAV5_9ASCO|nr:aldo/keto reductase [Suhomyces tanzawaensis NRRL Y-17324]ODV76608.1 aldo/keto reductase [Suhomyces tanzawaensis NRRL Y-17324]
MPAHKSSTTFKLSTGASIPAVGLGTWQSSQSEVYDAVLAALESGYRHIDTAYAYLNEEAVGKAIKDSGIPREQIFVTTKLAAVQQLDPTSALNDSLKRLDLDYVDLYLMHWPVALNPNNKSHPLIPILPNGDRDVLHDFDFIDSYKVLQELADQGKTKAIGVSNFSIKNLTRLLEHPSTTIKPVVNQVELHPYLPQNELLEFTKKHEILLEAYSPLGSTNSPLLTDETIVKIAKNHNVSPATILISWAVWRGTVVLPKSVTPSRIESNFLVVDLTSEEGKQLDNIHKEKGIKRLINPKWSKIDVFTEV